MLACPLREGPATAGMWCYYTSRFLGWDKAAKPDKGLHVHRSTTSTATNSSTSGFEVAAKESDPVLFLGPSGRLAIRALDLLLEMAGESPDPTPCFRRKVPEAARCGPPDHRSTWWERIGHPEFLRERRGDPSRR